MASRQRVQPFANLFRSSGHWKSDGFNQNWANLIAILDSNFDAVGKELGDVKALLAQSLQGQSGGAVSDASLSPTSTGVLGYDLISSERGVPVVNTAGLLPGQLVVYRGTVLGVATNNTENMDANFAVGKIQGNTAYLYQTWSSGLLKIPTNRGTNSSGYLWLGRNGYCTDVVTDVQDANGDFQNGALFLQQVGYSQLKNGIAPSGFVRCSLDLRGLHY
jgi:hypothetical protein